MRSHFPLTFLPPHLLAFPNGITRRATGDGAVFADEEEIPETVDRVAVKTRPVVVVEPAKRPEDLAAGGSSSNVSSDASSKPSIDPSKSTGGLPTDAKPPPHRLPRNNSEPVVRITTPQQTEAVPHHPTGLKVRTRMVPWLPWR